MGPLSSFVLALMGVLQAIYAARGATMNPWLWSIVGIVLFWEFLSKWETTASWKPLQRLVVCFGAAVAIIGLVWQVSIPNITVTTDNNRAFITKAQDGSTYLRFAVTFAGSSKAICRAYLDDRYRLPDKTPLAEKFHLMLSAEDGGEPGIANGFTFYNGTQRFFNLAYITPDHKLLVAAKTYRDITSDPLTPGEYQAKVQWGQLRSLLPDNRFQI
jgi:hypothetical protein